MCSLTLQNVFSYSIECVLLLQNEGASGGSASAVFSYYRICSLTTECVLLLQNVFSYSIECVLLLCRMRARVAVVLVIECVLLLYRMCSLTL